MKPGELVAIAGGSGAGKTTLLEILAGLQPPSAGQVRHDGVVRGARTSADSRIGYVPQDDIIHLEMPLRRTLRYAARLRPAGTSAAEADRVVEETMRDLDLADRADVPVRALSGGQRKRASIAVELLTRPRLFFLDEPTSGLDPSTAADVMRLLRRLSQRGVTVVLTRMSRRASTGVTGWYSWLATATWPSRQPDRGATLLRRAGSRRGVRAARWRAHPQIWAKRFVQPSGIRKLGAARHSAHPATRSDVKRTGAVRQWWLLTRRNVDVLFRNRLTLAILLGSPVLVTAMMATLFKRGAFDPGCGRYRPGADRVLDRVRWLLLRPDVRPAPDRRGDGGLPAGALGRPQRRGLRGIQGHGAASGLAGVSAVLLGVLRVLGRLPAVGWHVYLLLFVTIVIEATSALALGLLASAAVSNAAQAALALPMLCFPQVLFGGAIVPVDEMATPGRLMSFGLSNRHAFEALGRDLDLDRYTARCRRCPPTATPSGRHTGSLIALADVCRCPHGGHCVGPATGGPPQAHPGDDGLAMPGPRDD